MRKAISQTLALTLILSLAGTSFIAHAAVKAGSSCSKAGMSSVSGGKKFTCVKSGKKLVWDKGVLVPVTKPAPSASAKPVVVQAKEGDSCEKMGVQAKDSTGLLECRKFADNKLKYVLIKNDYSPVVNPKSPDEVSLCRLSDKRTVIPPNTYAIAYPPKPFRNYKPTGTNKVVVVGIDFSDVPGSGSPSAIWKDDLQKTTEWLKWYTNDKVKFDFVSYPQWFRAPRASKFYDSANHGPKAPGDAQAGGLTGQEIAEDYIHAIEDTADLSNVNTVWFYFPPDIEDIDGQWTQQTSRVVTKKYGTITPQLVALGGDTYMSKRSRWGYFIHEMLHGFGLQGHSPKFLPPTGFTRIGALSTADGWTNALLPWDALTWGVEKPEDIYCIDKSNVNSTEVKLVPLEREQEGPRSVMVHLNDHQVLLVESHRSDKWGVGEGQGFTGVMVALIDTTISTDWDDDKTYKDPNTTSTGVYLLVDGANHGKHVPIGTKIPGDRFNGIGVVNGMGIAGDYEGWDLNRIMYTGESITNSGIKVTLIKGGDNDTIRIEKM